MDVKTRTEIFVLNTLIYTHTHDNLVGFICIALTFLELTEN